MNENNLMPSKLEHELVDECIPHLKKRYEKIWLEVPFHGLYPDLIFENKEGELECCEAKIYKKTDVLRQCLQWSAYGSFEYISILWFSTIYRPLRRACVKHGFGLYFYNENTKIFWEIFKPQKRKVVFWEVERKKFLNKLKSFQNYIGPHSDLLKK